MSVQFILFLDPETRNFYSFNSQKGIIVQEQPTEKFKRLRDEQLKDYEILCDGRKWLKLDSFHHRPIPKYLLPERIYKYPVYITRKHMPHSLLEDIKFNDNGIKIKQNFIDKVNIRVYLHQIRRNFQVTDKTIPLTLEVVARFLISANEIIRIICRKILHEYGVVITAKTNNKIVFKVRHQKQYIYGNQPIINFESVRQCVKKQETISLQILESDIKNKEQLKKFIFTREWKDIKNGLYESFPWDDLNYHQDNQFLIYYKPDAYFINPYHKLPDKNPTNQIAKNYRQLTIKMDQKKKQNISKVPRYLWKDAMIEFLKKRERDIKDMMVDLEGSIIYTGQCTFKYSFHITAVNNFVALLRIPPKFTKQTSHPILKFTNKEILETRNFQVMPSALQRSSRFQQIRKQNLLPFLGSFLSIRVLFYYNGTLIDTKNIIQTPPVTLGSNASFNLKVQWKQLSKIMMETSIVFQLLVWSKEGQGMAVGVGVLKLFDEYGFLRQGQQVIQILEKQKIEECKLGCINKIVENNQKNTKIVVKLPTFRQPVRWTLCSQRIMKSIGYFYNEKDSLKRSDEKHNIQDITPLLSRDPLHLHEYSDKEKEVLRKSCKYYKHQSGKLINYLFSIDWTQPQQIMEAYQTINEWALLTPLEGLLLLTPHFSDEKIRFFAVKVLQKIEQHDLVLYANQITQALVSFQTHQNPLIDFLLQKSSQNPYVVGQEYFWQFMNRLNDPIVKYRFSLYLQALIMTSSIRKQFVKQINVNNTLINMNKKMIEATQNKDIEGKNKYFQSILHSLQQQLIKNNPQGFSFPIRPQCLYKKIIPSQSKVFDSKKCPFNLSCLPQQKSSQLSYKIMFKYGDDIKQDHLILQIFKIFQNLWLDDGFDFKMSVYKVLPTGDQLGFIQIVDNAFNNSKIHKQFKDGLVGAFDEKTTLNFLEKYSANKKQLLLAKQNFLRSCAGYCVATYVLGIGDRHSGNIMIQKSGKFFHIDFGHILGNFKMKFGVKRQRTPLVFTSQYAYVMGGQNSATFEEFEKLCARAYNILRKNGNFIISLLMMMVGAEIPQLQNYSNINYVLDQLSLELSESQAAQKIKKVISQTLQSEKSKQLDNAIHQGIRDG